ncbi:MAG: hypothetical protein ACOYOU_05870 [Kiritimatiellia bacterium]
MKYNRSSAAARIVMLVSAACGLLSAGCASAPSPRASSEEQSPWRAKYARCREMVLSGPAEMAEIAWADLDYTGSPKLDKEDLKLWLDFQVEILEKTQHDPAKQGLQLQAVQEISYYSQFNAKHRAWLEKAVTTHFFSDKKVIQKAKDVLERKGGLDGAKGTSLESESIGVDGAGQ